MNYEKVSQALESLGLSSLYLANFKDNKCDDTIVAMCLSNPLMAGSITQLIPNADHLSEFRTAFTNENNTKSDLQSSSTPIHANTGCPDDEDIAIDRNKNFELEAEARDLTYQIRENFEETLDKLVEETTDFEVEGNQEKVKAKDNFLSTIKTFKLSEGFTTTLVGNLDKSINQCFEKKLKNFRKRQQMDKNKVKTALVDANKMYRQQMDTPFSSTKEYLPDFHDLSQTVKTEIIKHCKEEFDLTPKQEIELMQAMKTIEKEYEDKNTLRTPQKDVAIGIDLGTTYSCVSVYKDGQVIIIPNELGKTTTPSYVAFRTDGSRVVGRTAKCHADEDPENTVFDAKRLIGRNLSDPILKKDMKIWPFKVVKASEDVNNNNHDVPKIKVNGRTYFPEEISAIVLQHMKTIAENYLGREVSNAVVTVPAYFNSGQRQATIDAGEIAGLKILKIINEPTAAAIAYNLHRTDDLERNVLIFDLGGGTFDVAVLTMRGGEINVRAVGGDTHLGGQDFDNELVNYCFKKFKERYESDLLKEGALNSKSKSSAISRALRRIRVECEIEKCSLSSTNRTKISLDAVYEGHDLHVPITRKQFEEFNEEKFHNCITIVNSVIADARLTKEEIDDVVLVGGSSRIPKVQEMLSNLFGGKALCKSLNPDEAIAHGAAIQAAILNGEQAHCSNLSEQVYFDVTPFSIGVKDGATGNMIFFIKKNSKIPCEFEQVWTNSRDYMTKGSFEIYEGEDPIASKNHLLGKFELSDIPPKKSGEEDIVITTKINDEGILHVTAVVKSNKSFAAITISDSRGRLRKEQIAEMKLQPKLQLSSENN